MDVVYPDTASGELLSGRLLYGNWTYVPSRVWRRPRLLGGAFRVDLDIVQELTKLFDIVASGETMEVEAESVFQHSRHSASVSAVAVPDRAKFRQRRTWFYEAAARSSALGWTRAA